MRNKQKTENLMKSLELPRVSEVTPVDGIPEGGGGAFSQDIYPREK